MLLDTRQFPQLGCQLEGSENRVLAGQGDVGLAGQAPVGVQPVLGQTKLVELHFVTTFLDWGGI